jgi:hypothetical protein
MDVSYSEDLSQAFVADPTNLKKLVELLQKRIGKVNISANCVDEIERKFNTVKNLIAYENSKSKRIRRIHLSARSDDYSKSVTIVFRDSRWYSLGASIDINGREDVVSRLREEVSDIAVGMRPWYNWIASADLAKIYVIGFGILLSILAMSILFEWIPIPDSPSSDANSVDESVKESAFKILFTLGAVLGLWSFYWLRGFLFPKEVFTIGQGESRCKHMEQVRWGIVITFLVSFAAGLLLLIL